MAHMIDESTGVAAIAYSGRTPWHGLGHRMTQEQRTNVGAALKLAGLEWRVGTKTLHYAGQCVPGANTGLHDVSDAKGIIRLDTGAYLGTVGKGFTPIQHVDAFEAILTPLVEEYGCTIECAGSLDEGRRQFALIKMPDTTIQVGDGDRDDVRGYFCLANGHDGSQAFRGLLSPIRVVCQNTLTAAQAAAMVALAVKHTKSAPERVKVAAKLMARMQEAMKATGETYNQLAKRTMNAKELAAYIETVIPAPKPAEGEAPTISDTIKARREAIADLIFNGHHVADGVTDARYGVSTAWRAYNAVTEYFDHVRIGEAKSDSGKHNARDSALFGGNAIIKANALRVLVAA